LFIFTAVNPNKQSDRTVNSINNYTFYTLTFESGSGHALELGTELPNSTFIVLITQ